MSVPITYEPASHMAGKYLPSPHPTSATTAINGRPIAAQCCDKGGLQTCRRSAPGKGCIAGDARGKPPTEMTYAAAKATCDSLGLDLCEKDCKDTGCMYNNFPVYTKLSCDLGQQ